jgi:hypothetical protein
MHSGYKEGRALSTRFNRREDVGEQSVEQELESMKQQMGRLLNLIIRTYKLD